jgi:hypothetical protein
MDLDQHKVDARHTPRQSETRRANTRTEFHHTIFRACMGRGGKQDRVMPGAMTAPWLTQAQRAIQKCVLGQIAGQNTHRSIIRFD